MGKLIIKFAAFADSLLFLFVYPSAFLLKIVRKVGVDKLPLCKGALLKVGLFPIINHYYEPQFDFRCLDNPLSKDRVLPGVDWNVQGQLNLLDKLTFSKEIIDIFNHRNEAFDFCINNNFFGPGDAEYWYQIIRLQKPKKIIEVGSGHSTIVAIEAIRKNMEEKQDYICKHICIEPYEAPWLENLGVTVLREKVEEVEVSFFSELTSGDFLFIDSSHIIRPQGDVLFEYLRILPTLNNGVFVHVHDIFSPRNYPEDWLKNKVVFSNEQYLVEAFLTHNTKWKIVGALNYLYHNHYDRLVDVCPSLTVNNQPGSFYVQKSI